jgi:hypothetical protein
MATKLSSRFRALIFFTKFTVWHTCINSVHYQSGIRQQNTEAKWLASEVVTVTTVIMLSIVRIATDLCSN